MERNLIDAIRNSGVVGAGGAGFPTHVKMNAKAEYVIINGAECEPLLRVDQQLMALQAGKLLEGLQLLVEHTGAEKGIVALKKKYHDAIDALNEQITKYPKLQIHQMDNFYPAGDEQVLVYEATGRIIPEGGIPLHVGVIVSNVETVLNVVDAVQKEQPVTSKYVTITGEVAEKKTVKVPLGITVREVLELAGGPTVSDYVVINGGPMMGKPIDVDDYITKTVKGLIVLPKDHSLLKSLGKNSQQMLKEAKIACMNCSMCSEVCPRGMLGHRIQPHKLMRVASYGSVCDSTQSIMNAFLCCGCRLCEYACVMNLQPWKLNGILKDKMAQAGVKNELNMQPETVNKFRDFKRFPVTRLIARLGLTAYDKPAPLEEKEYSFKKVTLPLKQHVGAPAAALVKTGDTVVKGQMIADMKDGALGTSLHASINGTIRQVTEHYIVIERD